jgi:hypothetical protein
MSLEEILKAGEADTPSKVKYPAKLDGDFMVSMEAPHQLHCLVSYATPKVRSFLAHVL